MKKLLLATMLFTSSLSFALETNLRFGGITNGKKYSNEKTFKNYSPAVGLEITQSLLLFDVGMGIQYNKGNPGLDMATLPVYGLAKWNIIPIGIKPYLVGKVGNSIYSKEKLNGEDPKATLYYGAGVGVDVLFLQGELLYSITKIENSKKYDTLNQVSLTLGYKL
ncbi:MAG: hypothetical protein ACRC6A_01405 [Fusobacteriaceae bacterium]